MTRPFRLSTALLSIVVLASSTRSAEAGFALTFGQTNYSAAPGGTVDVSVYLSETDNAGTLASQGLSGAGVTVSFNLPVLVADPAQVSTILANPGVDPINDLFSTSITPATATTTGTATLDWFLITSPTIYPLAGSSEILVGTFTFNAGTTPGQDTNISVGLSGPSGTNFYLGDGITNIDSQINTFGTSMITVQGSVVPEPSTLILVGSGALFWLVPIGIRRHLSRS